MALVSLVVTTYRRPGLLRQALDSLAAQTYEDLEVLVCDNDADPAVAELVRQYGPRFAWHPRPENLGLLANALLGFRSTTGSLVAKHDDDDVLHPRCVELLAAPLLADPSLSLAFGDSVRVDDSGRVLDRPAAGHNPRHGLSPGPQRDLAGLVVRRAVELCPTLLRRGAVDWSAVPPSVGTAYDVHVPLEAAARGGFWYVDQPLASIRMHAGQDTRQQLLQQQQGALAAMLLARGTLPPDQRPALEAGIRIKTLSVYRLLIEAGQRSEARELVSRTVSSRMGPVASGLLVVDHLPARLRTRVLGALERRRRARQAALP